MIQLTRVRHSTYAVFRVVPHRTVRTFADDGRLAGLATLVTL